MNSTYTEADLRADIGSFHDDPLRCVKYCFPWQDGALREFDGPREWQADILDTIGEHLRSPQRFQPLKIAVASGHGVGKSALIAMISHWAMSTCDDCRVLVTANTEDQLVTKTWPEITKWFGLALNKHWWNVSATRITSREPGHENTWRMDRETWSENNTEAFQGLHNLRKRIVLVFDEGSAIPKTIWEVAEGALSDEDTEIIFLAFGNPTQNSTSFAACFGALRHRWICRHVDARKVPGTNKAQIQKWIDDFGEDSDFVRVRVRGEFPRAGTSQFVPQTLVAKARKRTVEPSGWKIIAVDVARFGSNQTVIGVRHGAQVRVLQRLRGADTVETSRRVAHWIMQESPRACIIDGDGIGGGVVDQLRAELPKPNQPEKEWPDTALARWFKANRAFTLQEFHGAAKPADPFMYFNKRAEVWGLMKKWLEAGQIPDDSEFESDLTGPEYFFSAKNTIQLERKEDMEARGQASPDNGDMLAMTFSAFPTAETRDEKVVRQQAQIKEPMALHFAKLAETERRKKLKQPKNYWD